MPSKTKTAMIHLTPATRDRLNAIAKPAGLTHEDLILKLLEQPQPQPPTPLPPLATKATIHKPLLQYTNGCTLRIDSTGQPYICSQDNQHWRPMQGGKVQPPWE